MSLLTEPTRTRANILVPAGLVIALVVNVTVDAPWNQIAVAVYAAALLFLITEVDGVTTNLVSAASGRAFAVTPRGRKLIAEQGSARPELRRLARILTSVIVACIVLVLA